MSDKVAEDELDALDLDDMKRKQETLNKIEFKKLVPLKREHVDEEVMKDEDEQLNEINFQKKMIKEEEESDECCKGHQHNHELSKESVDLQIVRLKQ